MSSRVTSFARFWLPALAWTAIVLGASNDQFSASHTEEFFTPLLHFFLPAASPSTIDLLHFLIRKTAHVCAYGLLGVLYLRAQRGQSDCFAVRWAVVSLAICLLVAGIDEVHQSFVPTRTGTWHDVVLDMVGAVMFQVIAVGMMRRDSLR